MRMFPIFLTLALVLSSCGSGADCESACDNAVDGCGWYDYHSGWDDCVDNCQAADFDDEELDCLSGASCHELSHNECYPPSDHHHGAWN